MHLPEINGKNYAKVLRELDLAKFPSMPFFLKEMHDKLKKKIKLTEQEQLKTLGQLKKYFKDFKLEQNSFVLETFDWSVFDNRPPKSFQKIGIEFLIINDKCILADDMGLGKSIQSIMASKMLPDEYKILVVTLNTLKYNFYEEIAYFDDRISVVDKQWITNKYTIIHYDAVKKYQEQIIEQQFDIFIMDECHLIKNKKAKRTELFLEIFKKSKKEVKKIWLLTGTPIDNKPIEYYNLLRIIRHPVADNWLFFIKRYCDAFQNRFGQWVTKGSSNLNELHNKIKGSILRRLKTEELENFPEKTRTTIALKLDNIKGYQKSLELFQLKKFLLENETLEELIEIDNNNSLEDDFFGAATPIFKSNPSVLPIITKIMIWRQWCAIEKIDDGSTLELIENEISKGKKIVVFTNFTAVIDKLSKKLGKVCLTLDGRIKSVAERQKIVNEFNKNPDIFVFVVNFQLGATGLNLQSADTMLMNDLPYKPSLILQGEDRIYRIGQKNDCRILYPFYKNSIEEKVFQIIIKKVNMISQVLDGKKIKFVTDIDLPLELEPTKKDILEEISKEIVGFNI